MQRTRNNATLREADMLREANRLLELRARTRSEYGDQYTEFTAPFRPFVAVAMRRLGCPKRAAAHVVDLLKTQEHDTTPGALKKLETLVSCAALDLAVPDDAGARMAG